MAKRERVLILVLLEVIFLISCNLSTTKELFSCDAAALINAIEAANTSVNQSNIILMPDCVYNLNTVNNYYKEVPGATSRNGLPPISTPITIEGNNAIIQRQIGSGLPEFRIFYVSNYGTLTLNDLSILQGYADKGAGIFSNGIGLTLNNVQVENNTAESQGGGIYNNECTLAINNSSISDNQSQTGGGIYSFNARVMIDGDSMLNNNQVSGYGGAISSDRSAVTILGGQLSDNQAETHGGAIYMTTTFGLSTLTLEDVLFERNTSNGRGGAISLMKTSFTITGSTFYDNQALGINSYSGMGGAININSGDGTISAGSIFDGNYSGGSGGAIKINQDYGGSITIQDTTIQNNTAEGDVGGIMNTDGKFSIIDSTITGNSALTESCGGLALGAEELTIRGSMILNNSAALSGGGACVSGSLVNIWASTFQGNQSGSLGGGLSSGGGGISTIGGGSVFDSNTAEGGGGGIFKFGYTDLGRQHGYQ